MARSRNIKPGFFTNDELAECEPLARLLFAGLWTEADREGRLEDRPKKLKAAILPYDDCNADDLLNQLARRGFILRYQAGAAFIQITSFSKHQDPHYKEKASEIPAPPGHTDTGKTPGAPSDELRAEILARDGACRHCQSTTDLTLDHIIPRSKGGTHDESNLQALCRRCNSAKNNREAKPIIGQSSANELGGKSPLIPSSLIPSSLIPDSLSPDSSVAPAAPSGKPARKPRAAKPAPPSAEVWSAYAAAYENRYGVEPVRNASVNAQLSQVVGKLGAEEAPAVAAHFVGSQNGLYVAAMHPTNLLLRDAEKLRTEWATGRRVTRTQAVQADRTETNFNAFAPLLAQADQEAADAQP